MMNRRIKTFLAVGLLALGLLGVAAAGRLRTTTLVFGAALRMTKETPGAMYGIGLEADRAPRGQKRVGHQHGDRHPADAAGNRRDRAGARAASA